MRYSLFALSLVLLSVTFTNQAVAQDDNRAQARENFQSGVEQFESGDYEAALTAFQTAYRLAPHYSVRANMANCYERLGRAVEARENFRLFISEAGERASEEQLADVRASIERLSANIGTLALDVNPPGASIRIDRFG